MSSDQFSEARLSQGLIRYRDTGAGRPLVFVHGLLANSRLWRKVIALLEPRFRCVAPDLPLGSHRLPMNSDADLTPPGLARLIADFIAALGLDNATVVANDTGGALCQLLITTHPEHVSRLVLTPCDAYDNFPPPAFRGLVAAAKVPGAIAMLMQALRVPTLRNLPLAYGWLAKYPVDAAIMRDYVEPARIDRKIRRDLRKVLGSMSSRYTLKAAEEFGGFHGRVLIAWAPEDRFFPIEHAHKLAAAFRDARLETIPDSYTFVAEDQPAALARLIEEFMANEVALSA